MINKFNNRET